MHESKLQARVESLEARCQKLTWALSFAVLLVVLVAWRTPRATVAEAPSPHGDWASRSVADEVLAGKLVASELVIVDADGAPRIQLQGVGGTKGKPGGATLLMNGPGLHLVLSATERDAGLSAYCFGGKLSKAELTVSPQAGKFSLTDGTSHAALDADGEGASLKLKRGSYDVFAAAGTKMAGLGVQDGPAGVRLMSSRSLSAPAVVTVNRGAGDEVIMPVGQ